jgi:hypothetical protein
MKQETAVEKAIDLIKKDFEENGRLRFAYVQKVLNEAKEMERQQIIDAYDQGSEAGYEKAKNDDFIEGFKMKEAEQYYNETFS